MWGTGDDVFGEEEEWAALQISQQGNLVLLPLPPPPPPKGDRRFIVFHSLRVAANNK
jgi:hypothetical protein